MSQSRKGLMLVLISSVVFGAIPGVVTYCYSQGATATVMLLARYVILSLVLLPSALRTKGIGPLYRQHWKKLLALSFFCTFTAVFNFTAYRFIPTACASALHYMYPVIVMLICVFGYRDRVSKLKLLCLGLCFSGALLMLDASQRLDLRGVALALASAVVWGGYIVGVDKFDFDNLGNEAMLFFIELGNIPLILAYGAATDSLFAEISPIGWAVSILFNAFVAVCGTLFFTIGVRYTDAQTSAIASTLEPITSILVGIVLLGEPSTPRSLVGSAMILTAVILLSVFNGKEDQ